MSNSSLVNGYSDLRNSRKRSTMRQAISQYIKPIKHSQQMQILEQCKTKAYNCLTISKEGRSYGNCFCNGESRRRYQARRS